MKLRDRERHIIKPVLDMAGVDFGYISPAYEMLMEADYTQNEAIIAIRRIVIDLYRRGGIVLTEKSDLKALLEHEMLKVHKKSLCFKNSPRTKKAVWNILFEGDK